MSSRAVGDAIGVPASTIIRIFTGTGWPDWYTWTQLELKFGALAPNKPSTAGTCCALRSATGEDGRCGLQDINGRRPLRRTTTEVQAAATMPSRKGRKKPEGARSS